MGRGAEAGCRARRPHARPTADPRYLKTSIDCKHFAGYSLELWNGTDRHHFDAVAIGIDQTHHLAAAGLVKVLDRYTLMRREPLQILQRLGPQPYREKPRFAGLSHMQKRPPVAAPAVKPPACAERAEPEMDKKRAHHSQIGRGEAHVRNVPDLDHRHGPSLRFALDYLVI